MEDKINGIKDKLEYLDLDLNNIPKILLEDINSEIRVARNYEEKKYKVYKYVPISKIKILLTKANRLNSLRRKK
ncbi:MAG: hypothetical protein HFJ50_07590 [Clostridia bacterium]|jgi:hypothetical protein|nr:hypothetical protein [Clostridia bacterium]